jgi:hypothetical protein
MPTGFSGVSIAIIFDFRHQILVSGSRFAMAQVSPPKRHREQLTTTLNDRTISFFHSSGLTPHLRWVQAQRARL